MKKSISAMLVAVLLLCWTAVAYAAPASARFGVAYRSNTVNLRSRPTQNSAHLGTYAKGTWVQITGESGNWYSVYTRDGKTGYMSKNYVEVIPEAYAAVALVKNPKASGFLNLRSTPSYHAPVLGIYYNTAPAVVLDYTNGWYHVQVDGVSGYFREEFLDVRTVMAHSQQVATVVTPGNTALNLRSGPGMEYSVLEQFRGGQYVMVLQRGTDWWKVSVDGQVGFMNPAFLREGLLTPSQWNQGDSRPSVSTPSLSTAAYGVVTNPRSTQVLNLRSAPDVTARVLGQYVNGTKVNVLAQGTQWCKVQVQATGTVGYMMTQYLTLYNLPATPTKTVIHPQHTFVNLRSGASVTSGRVLLRVPHGKQVQILFQEDVWTKVRYGATEGYMMSTYLR